MKVALVHDYLTQRGGAERVFLAMCRAFPGAEIYASLYEPDLTFPDFEQFEVRTTPLNRVGAFRRHHRLALPLLPSAFARLTVDADVTICSSSGWAHGVGAVGAKLVYCHNPARWLYQTDQYAGARRSASKMALSVAGRGLRKWDRRAALSADGYLANSEIVRQRVCAAYGIEAKVLSPPFTLDRDAAQQPVVGLSDGFFLCVSRLLRYKNIEAIVEAFARLPTERLIIVGRGPLESRLRALAPSNVDLVGTATEPELRWLYADSRALIAASHEDFGLTPIEAMAFGKPSVVLRYGGFLETVIEGETGVFFDDPDATLIVRAINEVQQLSIPADLLMRRAAGYSEANFAQHLCSAVDSIVTLADRARSRAPDETSSN